MSNTAATESAAEYWDDPADESTGFLTHYIGTVRNSFWSNIAAESKGKVSGDGADATQLFWEVEVIDILQEDFGGNPPETLTVNLGIGKKFWTDPENEDEVEHEDDVEGSAPKKFHASSALGKLLRGVAGKDDYLGDYEVMDGGGDVEPDYADLKAHFVKNSYTGRNCHIWEGVTFEFRGLGFNYGNDRKPRAKAFPVSVVSIDGSVDPISGRKAAKASTPTVVSPWEAAGADASLAATLNKLMKASDSHESFVKNALMLDAVSGSDDLTAAVNDPANYGG